jgi:pilin isopeptide linkage protein
MTCALPDRAASATPGVSAEVAAVADPAAAETGVTINQEFSDLLRGAPSGDFRYQLAPVEPGDGPTGRATVTGTGQGVIEAVARGEAGSAFYELRCVTADKPGYVIDRRVYGVEVVEDSGGVIAVVARNPSGEKTAAPTFEHYFGLGLGPWEASRAEAMVESRLAVSVVGEPDDDALFAFELVSAEAEHPESAAVAAVGSAAVGASAATPAGPVGAAAAGSVVAQARLARSRPGARLAATKRLEIVGEGEGLFDPWEYNAPGIYRHTIKQVDMGAAGYSYDPEVFTITDVVGRAGGVLVATRAIVDSSGRQVTRLAFTNTYSPGGSGGPSPTPSPGESGGDRAAAPELPFTGANSLAGLGLAVLSALIGLWCLFARKRRQTPAETATVPSESL